GDTGRFTRRFTARSSAASKTAGRTGNGDSASMRSAKERARSVWARRRAPGSRREYAEMRSILKRGRRIGADDFARRRARVAKAVRQSAFEIVSVARTEDPRLACDGDFDAAFGDDTAFLAGVRVHLRVGAGRISLTQDRPRAMANAGPGEEDPNGAGAATVEQVALVEVVDGQPGLAG